MMLENQKPHQAFEGNYVYEMISETGLPIRELRDPSSQTINATSANHQAYKYWNPATFDDNSNSHAKSVDQLIGKLKQ